MSKGKRAIRVLAVAAVLIAVALGGGYYIRNTYTVRTVYVEGNVHYTEDEIKDIVMDGVLGDNSLYLSLKYRNKGIEGIPFVDVMDVSVLAPDTIKITVYEKMLTGYVKYLDTYMYFDKDGYVVESSSVRTAGVPQITGLEFDHIVLGEALPVENSDVFDSILNITKLLKKYALSSDKIYFSKSGDITVYFDEVKVALGNDTTTLEDKLMLLPELLPSLEGRNGTLQMQTYDESGGKYTFKPE
ncbi:MAG: cell division protein FtsQ/DivIB [Acetatifactor sp.]